jgi:cation diffusion facilitator family transporter
MAQDITAHAHKEKRTAALTSVLSASGLTVVKLVVGLLTGSLGIIAEAAHSGLDLVAALVTFFAVRLADRPPDKQHQYGHGKVENLSALIETLLLLLTCVWIIYEAVQRLFFHPVEIQATPWAFATMLGSIVVLVFQTRVLQRAADKHNSQALKADALHFSTDIWSSAVVVGGLVMVWLGERLGPQWAWLSQADAVAALVVAVIVIWVSLRLGREAVSVLLDAAPPGLTERIASRAGQVPGVQRVGPVRARQSGAQIFVDLTVDVDRGASLEEAHRIAEAVDASVSQVVARGDVVVHLDPVRHLGEDLGQTVGLIAGRLGLRTHDVHAHQVRDSLFVDLHVVVPPELNLGEAHRRVSQLEEAVHQELPRVREVHSHIEPAPALLADTTPLTPAAEEQLRRQILELAKSDLVHGCDRVLIRPGPEGYDVVLHCVAPAAMNVGAAHRLAHQAERRILAGMPSVGQVLIHLEPRP